MSKLNTECLQINKVSYGVAGRQLAHDLVINEQPLQIVLEWFEHHKKCQQVLAITMRTPGHDEDLIRGLLVSEGIVLHGQIEDIRPESDSETNSWLVVLKDSVIPQLSSLAKYQLTYSSCGLCGKTSLKALELKAPPRLNEQTNWLTVEQVLNAPTLMRTAQPLFSQTGGVHAAACFDVAGNLIDLAEDIGRHNAVDKLIGRQFSNLSKATAPNAMLVSGRVSFEIVQKAIMAGICVLMSVGAPSALAIKAAQRFNLTLIGFIHNSQFNVYHGEWRLHSTEDTCQKTSVN